MSFREVGYRVELNGYGYDGSVLIPNNIKSSYDIKKFILHQLLDDVIDVELDESAEPENNY